MRVRVVIAGYGSEGQASYEYYVRRGDSVVVADERDHIDGLKPGTESILGSDAFSRLGEFDLIIRSPGIKLDKLPYGDKVWSATNEFFANCPAEIIGVTGSKGKGTTCSLIASILQAAGRTVHLLGNIGQPALESLDKIQPDDIVVYELSSFQLWDIKCSPRMAVVLHIEPDHLDVHASFEEYIAAKGNIARYQTAEDYLVFNTDNDWSRAIAEQSPAAKIPYPNESFAYVIDGSFWYGDTRLCSVGALKLPGAHNQMNTCAAIDASWPYVQDGEVIERGLSAFSGLNHRLKFISELNGVRYYDDSIATTPGSAIAAIRAFDAPKIMILGGSSKGADFEELASVAAQSSVKLALLIGDEAEKISNALEIHSIPFINLGSSISMNNIVQKAAQEADSGDVVILSPACASFGMFKNYKDRGEQFIAAINSLEAS